MSSVVHAILEKLQIEYTEQKGGEELRFRCVHPKHTDNHPSTDINARSGAWICRSCGQKGNLARLVKLVTGEDIDLNQYVSPDEALLFKIGAIHKQSSESILKYENIIQFDDTMLNELKFFVPAIDHEESLKYLTGNKRKLTVNTIKQFDLKYSIGGDYRNRVVIPYYKKGKLIGFNSRYIYDGDKKFRYMYFLSHSQFKDYIYNLENVKNKDFCILVEGPFDLMILQQHGYQNVVSTLSTRVSESHLQHLLEFKQIVICFDNDIESHAGQKAAMKAASLILDISPTKQVYYCNLPDGKDPTEATEDELKDAFDKLIRFKKKK